MTKQEIKDHVLTKWLKSKRAYSKYVRNVKNGDMRADYMSHLEEMGNSRFATSTALSSGFLWLGTPEGHKYWATLCSNWTSFFHNLCQLEREKRD